jgi:molybdopterin-guanine dinucleotide biosynthesis protein
MAFVVGIGGSGSGSGKTTLACQLLRSLRGWGAIKCTPTLLYSSVTDDPETLSRRDKDTGKYLEAGASEVLWVQSTREDLGETLRIAVDRLSHLEGIVLEGNSAIEVLRPDVVIFISVNGPETEKKSARTVLRSAEVVIFETVPPAGIPEKAMAFHKDDREGYIKYIKGMIDERKA